MDGIKESTSKSKTKTRNMVKHKVCKVLSYNKDFRELDIEFDGYGLKIKNVGECNSETVNIDYHGEIGTPSFAYKLKE